MFTGIVEKTVQVIGAADGPAFRRLTIASDDYDVRNGQSIAINGCCLTVAEVSNGEIAFDVIQETLDKTNLGLLARGDEVNFERALKAGDRIDGHFVQGHIDGRVILLDRIESGCEFRYRLQAPDELAKFLVPKGSVTLDGVSLTIAGLSGGQFEVALIPTTLNLTTLGRRQVGWPFNLETDVLAKTIISWLEKQRQ